MIFCNIVNWNFEVPLWHQVTWCTITHYHYGNEYIRLLQNWHSSCFLYGIVVNQINVIKLQNFHYVIFNAQKEQCHPSTLGHNSAQFVLCISVLKKFVHQLHSFQSCTDKFSVQYRHLDTLLADCWHTTLALHLEAFGFSVLTRNEESKPIHHCTFIEELSINFRVAFNKSLFLVDYFSTWHICRS